MTNALLQPHYYTPEEYLALERKAEFKSEYYDGRIYAMAGASDPHNVIAGNVITELNIGLKGKPCKPRPSDAKVRSDDEGLLSYPDVTVVCGKPEFYAGTTDVLINPKLLVEILSPSSEAFDRGKKFAKYKQLESFTDYLLVAQDEPQIDYFVRQASGDWLQKSFGGMDAEIHIASLDCTLRLADIYDAVLFPPKSQIRAENETEE